MLPLSYFNAIKTSSAEPPEEMDPQQMQLRSGANASTQRENYPPKFLFKNIRTCAMMNNGKQKNFSPGYQSTLTNLFLKNNANFQQNLAASRYLETIVKRLTSTRERSTSDKSSPDFKPGYMQNLSDLFQLKNAANLPKVEVPDTDGEDDEIILGDIPGAQSDNEEAHDYSEEVRKEEMTFDRKSSRSPAKENTDDGRTMRDDTSKSAMSIKQILSNKSSCTPLSIRDILPRSSHSPTPPLKNFSSSTHDSRSLYKRTRSRSQSRSQSRSRSRSRSESHPRSSRGSSRSPSLGIKGTSPHRSGDGGRSILGGNRGGDRGGLPLSVIPSIPPTSQSPSQLSVDSSTSNSNGQKQFLCPMCNKFFTQKGNLKTHMMIHTGEKPYSCQICGRSFTQKGNVDTHMKIHTGEKDYGCESCGKRFTRKGNLKTHVRSVHTKEKPFACGVCGKCFSQKGNMQTHLRTHNKDDRFPCPLCGKTFSQKGNLKTHMQRHSSQAMLMHQGGGPSSNMNNMGIASGPTSSSNQDLPSMSALSGAALLHGLDFAQGLIDVGSMENGFLPERSGRLSPKSNDETVFNESENEDSGSDSSRLEAPVFQNGPYGHLSSQSKNSQKSHASSLFAAAGLNFLQNH